MHTVEVQRIERYFGHAKVRRINVDRFVLTMLTRRRHRRRRLTAAKAARCCRHYCYRLRERLQQHGDGLAACRARR